MKSFILLLFIIPDFIAQPVIINHSPGKNSIASNKLLEITKAGLSSGVYFYKLSYGEFVSSKKLMLIK